MSPLQGLEGRRRTVPRAMPWAIRLRSFGANAEHAKGALGYLIALLRSIAISNR